MMCQRCRDKVHPKFASAEDHTIIDIKDIHQHPEEEPKPAFTKLKCSDHSGQNCCLYCNSCSELVCPLCVSKSHKRHYLTDIIEGYNIQLEKVKNKQRNIQIRIEILSHEEVKLSQIKFLEESSYKKSKQGIMLYKLSLIKAIEKRCDELESELDQKWSDLSKSVTDEEQRVRNTKETLIKQNDEVNLLYQSDDTMKVLSSKSLLQSMKTNIQPVKTDFDHVPKFVPGDVTKVSILHGQLEEVSSSYNINSTVVQQFQTECKAITNLVECPNDVFWINDQTLKVIQKVNSNKDNLQVKCKFSIYVFDMTLTSSGDLLLSVAESSVLKVIPSGTEEIKDSVYSVSPLETIGVHVTKDNKVIIGAGNAGPLFPATASQPVIILNESGRQEKVFQFDSNKKALFTVPRSFTSNINNTIGVVDQLSDDNTGRVIILDQDGVVKHIYTGHSRSNSFKPYGIVTTLSGNFVIPEPLNHTLHVLSSEGEIINYYSTLELGIVFPLSPSFIRTGLLYIGCFTHPDSDEKAIIYKISSSVQ